MMSLSVQLVLLFILVSYVYSDCNISDVNSTTNLCNDFPTKLRNFSVELSYHIAKDQNDDSNLILSPVTVWTVMSLLAEGASGDTLAQINYALRITDNKTATRTGFQNIAKWLEVHSNSVELQKMNAIFVDKKQLLLRDFQNIAKNYYDTQVIQLNFTDDKENLARKVNQAISIFTNGKIPQLLDSSKLSEVEMVLASALYFKGEWTVPFEVAYTERRPFYDSNGKIIGEVNMMNNRYKYTYANIEKMQARVIEIPYGKEQHLSMLIMLPYSNVRLEDMFLNFQKVPPETLFAELKTSREEFGDEEIECVIPRFRIESSLDMTNALQAMGIHNVFDSTVARLTKLARTPLYVSKVIHKATIEVTEEGTVAAAVTAAELANKIAITRFEANRPFFYVVIEKVTNTMLFGGFYRIPSLY